MKDKFAYELMISIDKYPRVLAQDTLHKAILEMDKVQLEVAGRKSLPRVVLVFDGNEKLIGCVRRRDLFRGLEPGFLVNPSSSFKRQWFDVKVDLNLGEMSEDQSVQTLLKNKDRKVKQVMLPIAATIEHTDHVVKIISTMVQFDISMIPVMKDGKVIGIVRSADILHYLCDDILVEGV